MNKQLHESTSRGTFLFPFGFYHTEDTTGTYYVSCHWHTEVEVIYLKKGQIELFINGESTVLSSETIIFINSEELHQLNCLSLETVYDAFVFPLSLLSFDYMDYCQQKYVLPLMQKKLLFPRFLFPDHPCFLPAAAQLDTISSLHAAFPHGYQITTKAALFQLLSLFVQNDMMTNQAGSDHAISQKKLETMKKITAYVEEHLEEKMSLDSVSARFYMSPNYFFKYFKYNFGTGFTEYVNSVRLEKACGLLLETDLPIMEISLQCGFENLSYFIRTFKKKKGIPPSRYRRQDSLS